MHVKTSIFLRIYSSRKVGKVLKPSNFKYKKNMAFTRREYMGGVPGSKIVKFTMGNSRRKYQNRLELVNIKEVQIRHNALESARIAANRVLEGQLGRENFHLKIITYPHRVIREHKRVNVAQADRFQEGMKKAYGKPTAVAAFIKRGQTIIIAQVDKEHIDTAKEALKRASAKFPSPSRIVVKEN
jgi:large subunit ribosomal protein L10e